MLKGLDMWITGMKVEFWLDKYHHVSIHRTSKCEGKAKFGGFRVFEKFYYDSIPPTGNFSTRDSFFYNREYEVDSILAFLGIDEPIYVNRLSLIISNLS